MFLYCNDAKWCNNDYILLSNRHPEMCLGWPPRAKWAPIHPVDHAAPCSENPEQNVRREPFNETLWTKKLSNQLHLNSNSSRESIPFSTNEFHCVHTTFMINYRHGSRHCAPPYTRSLMHPVVLVRKIHYKSLQHYDTPWIFQGITFGAPKRSWCWF